MWIVRLALRRPYTFVVVALLIAVLGIGSILRMQTDIFPSINIPVITVIWSYGGLSPTEMQDRITTVVERAMTTTVNNIEHIESQSVRGNSVIKIFFQPGADVNAAEAEVTSICQTLIKPLPPGITPPLIIKYNAAGVPVIQTSLSSDTLSQQEISDLGNNFIASCLRRQKPRRKRRSGSRCALRKGDLSRPGHQCHSESERHRLGRHGEDGTRRIRRRS